MIHPKFIAVGAAAIVTAGVTTVVTVKEFVQNHNKINITQPSNQKAMAELYLLGNLSDQFKNKTTGLTLNKMYANCLPATDWTTGKAIKQWGCEIGRGDNIYRITFIEWPLPRVLGADIPPAPPTTTK